jgi:multidrug efflux pump subunit AcrA (membrane-fusion protein)
MRHVLLAAFAALALAACSKGADKPAAPTKGDTPSAAAAAPASAPTLLISPEDLRAVGTGDASQGPVITGSIQPERRADLRAEVSAVVLQVLKENGEAVRTGDLLVKLDDTSIRDSLASAEESQRAAGQAFEQAERQVQRLKTLQAQGMTSMQALEDAEVRAPFEGIVSERKVSSGDTAQIGKELLKVIDPRSMRFEGTVSADRMHEIKLGQDVKFRVNGYPDAQFAGKVKRVDASANPTTRQVEVLVAFADPASAPRVAGLYAEGRIATGGGNGAGGNNNGNTAQPLMLAEASIVRQGGGAYVWRIKDNKLQKVAVQLGERDARTGEIPVKGGLAEGDRILRNPGSTLVDGQKIEFAGPTTTAAASSAAMR